MEEDSEAFYNKIAEKYDWFFSDWNEMKNQEMKVIIPLLKENNVKKVLDCSCGTGLQSIGLLENGFKVLASDLSKNMIDQAINNANIYGFNLDTVQADFRDLKSKISKRFDAIICMGNSLSHLLTIRDIKLALKNMRDLLEENGMLIIEIRNFDKLIENKTRFIPIKVNTPYKNRLITIFYVLDYLEHICRFNVIYIIQEVTSKEYSVEVNSVNYNPIKETDFKLWLKEIGFNKVDLIKDDYFIKYIVYK